MNLGNHQNMGDAPGMSYDQAATQEGGGSNEQNNYQDGKH